MRNLLTFLLITLAFSCQSEDATTAAVGKATATRELAFLKPVEIVCKSGKSGCMHEGTAFCRVYSENVRYSAYCGSTTCYNVEVDLGNYR